MGKEKKRKKEKELFVWAIFVFWGKKVNMLLLVLQIKMNHSH